jgi:transcriptional regulator with XRE-family HTH domain
MKPQIETQTAGGRALKALRDGQGKTQLAVEMEASLGLGYLQRLERGKVQRPERETLERILTALDVTGFVARRQMLTLFGYSLAPMLPTPAEVQAAITAFEARSLGNPLPMYLLDCAHHLLAWNGLATRVFGPLAPLTAGDLMPGLVFDTANGLAEAVLNPESFFSTQIQILDYEQQRLGNEAWYSSFVDDMRHYQVFNTYWLRRVPASPAAMSLRPAAELQLAWGGGGLHFRLIAEPLLPDDRFRVVYYLPVEPKTIRACLAWQG